MADENVFAVELVTPERVLLSGVATEVTLRTGEGDVTFLAGHTPLVGTIKRGVVRVVRPEQDEERVASHGGFVQVEQGLDTEDGSGAASGTRVTLLFGVAELAEEIDVARAEVARQAAESRLSELGGPGGQASGVTGPDGESVPDPEVVEAEATLLRAQVRLEALDAATGAPAT
jgi:F-type H+-transporting ATPase subunit epsilon